MRETRGARQRRQLQARTNFQVTVWFVTLVIVAAISWVLFVHLKPTGDYGPNGTGPAPRVTTTAQAGWNPLKSVAPMGKCSLALWHQANLVGFAGHGLRVTAGQANILFATQRNNVAQIQRWCQGVGGVMEISRSK